MPDPLYLSLWFGDFDVAEVLARSLKVMRQFPFSRQQPGVGHVALHPVSWNEATVLERRFQPGISPEEAVLIASELLHADYAYVFEAAWDLWVFSANHTQWELQPSAVKIIVYGAEFEDGIYEQEGQIEIDFGLDSAFLQEEVRLTPEAETHVRANVQKLVEFTNKAENGSGSNARLLRSESDENLAQKLIARLQKVQ